MKIVPWKLAGFCLLLALAPLAGCAPGEEAEIADREATGPGPGETAGEATEPGVAPERPEAEPPEPGAPPAEEPAPGAAPGPEVEEPPPAAEMEDLPTDPEELEPEIEEAEAAPPAPAPIAAAESEAAGKQVFLDQRCGTCHSVSTAGLEAKVASGPTAGGDLAGVAQRRDRAAIEAILKQEETVGGKRHPKRFTGAQTELDALIDWLLAQG